MRRHFMRMRRAPGAAPVQVIPITQPSDLPGLFAFYDGTAVTIETNVDALLDQVGALDLVNTVDAQQPLLVASDARMNGQPTIETDGSDDRLIAAAAADWKFLHDGTGCTVYVVYRCLSVSSSRVIIDTSNATSANVGFSMFHNAATQALTALVTGGGGSTVINATTSAGVATNNVSRVVAFAYGEGAAPSEYEFRVGKAPIAAGNSAAAPSAANPAAALTLARLAVSGALPMNGVFAGLYFYKARHTTAEMRRFEAYAAARFGV